MKYLVFYTEGDISGSSVEHKIVNAGSPEDALKIILAQLDKRVDDMRTGFAPYYENVKIYIAPQCLIKFKGRDKNGTFI